MVKFLSAFAVVLASVASTFAYPTGAGTCNADATAIHYGMGFTQNPSGFSLSASSAVYTPGTPLTITVQGSGTFKGVLLYATLDDGTTRVGTWQIDSGFRSMPECTGSDPAASITHSNPNVKNAGTTFTWNPPASASGNVHFQGAIVPDMPYFDIFASVVLAPAAPPAPVVTTTTTVAAASSSSPAPAPLVSATSAYAVSSPVVVTTTTTVATVTVTATTSVAPAYSATRRCKA
ncbi:reeler domain-containing protein [Polychytrium aggregatum]|uniref:reeler domain-containing protein n=1 Tax=Polychytrium aggregatum TaxID=110093 RepID=UPI0022FF0A23|nr:reeler domain-containing protein [Polychytrium aggregatum]KAI9206661.1 reeler domain-containing protein [Polychytrium aggregatum]